MYTEQNRSYNKTILCVTGKLNFTCRTDTNKKFVTCPPSISKVTWQKLVNGTKQNVAIANPSLGVSVAPPYRDRVTFKNAAVRRRTPTLEDTTITFSVLRLSDEATYICEYTTFPAGNREQTVNLTVYGKTDVWRSDLQVRYRRIVTFADDGRFLM